jgi:hypothetical protein
MLRLGFISADVVAGAWHASPTVGVPARAWHATRRWGRGLGHDNASQPEALGRGRVDLESRIGDDDENDVGDDEQLSPAGQHPIRNLQSSIGNRPSGTDTDTDTDTETETETETDTDTGGSQHPSETV